MKYMLDFPLCFNKDAEETIRRYIVSSCDFIINKISANRIKAIILIGSFSKGEGSVFVDENKKIVSLSDFEFLTVLTDQNDFWNLRKKILIFNKEISTQFKNKNVDIEVDFGPYLEKLFKLMHPRMFTFDIKKYGKIIWGDKQILENISFLLDAKQIPQEDALILLFNRIIEQLAVFDNLSDEDIFEQQKILYKIGKTYLDIAASLMAFCKEYKAGYAERRKAYNDFWQKLDSKWLKNKLKNFPQLVNYWTNFKLAPFNKHFIDNFYPRGIESMKKKNYNLYFELIDIVCYLFIWELNSYLGCNWTEDVNVLIQGYCKNAHLSAKLKGWTKVLKHPFFSRNFSSIFRALLLIKKGSPKDLVYLNACRLYFMLPEIVTGKVRENISIFNKLQNLLPVVFSKFTEDKEDWHIYKENLIRNWQVFLKSDW